MRTFWLQIIGLLIVIFGAMMLTLNRSFITNVTSPFAPQNQQISNKLTIVDPSSGLQKALISVEIANTKEKRSEGLGGRESLASDSGMLFVFDKKDQHRFWMKGMRIALDFIWIDGDQIIDLLPNIPPPTPGQTDDTLPLFAPVKSVDKVLEVNSNFIRDHGLAIGDKIILSQQ